MKKIGLYAGLCLCVVMQLGFAKSTVKVPTEFSLSSGNESNPRVLGATNTEVAKISYLLNQIDQSPHTFMRGRKEYTGHAAANHLRWKYSKARHRVKTAKQFVEHIASRSILTGAPYLIRVSDQKSYLTYEVLLNELQKLNALIAKAEKRQEVPA